MTDEVQTSVGYQLGLKHGREQAQPNLTAALTRAEDADARRQETVAMCEQLRADLARCVEALKPLRDCYLPPPGYEHLGVTAHFTTAQVQFAKAALSPPPAPGPAGEAEEGA